jgi:hypothetical protein
MPFQEFGATLRNSPELGSHFQEFEVAFGRFGMGKMMGKG